MEREHRAVGPVVVEVARYGHAAGDDVGRVAGVVAGLAVEDVGYLASLHLVHGQAQYLLQRLVDELEPLLGIGHEQRDHDAFEHALVVLELVLDLGDHLAQVVRQAAQLVLAGHGELRVEVALAHFLGGGGDAGDAVDHALAHEHDEGGQQGHHAEHRDARRAYLVGL